MKIADMAAALRIPPDLLAEAGYRDADDYAVREALGHQGHRGADLGGILMPIRHPGSGEVLGHICRLRQAVTGASGTVRYLQPQACRWLLVYSTNDAAREDAGAPAVIVEGPKSALALVALARRTGRRLAVIATLGCWGWRRTVDHERRPDGALAPVTGPSPSLEWLAWGGRDAIVALDGDARSTPAVGAAQRALAHELARRGAAVRIASIPADAGSKAGLDDVLETCGDEATLAMLDTAQAWQECALGRAEAAVDAIEKLDAARRKTVDMPTAEIAEIADPVKQARFIGRLAALRIPGVLKADLERMIADHHAKARAERKDADVLARKGKLLGLRVNGATLLDALAKMLRNYVIETGAQADVEALWVVHSYAPDAAEWTPYLHITAPEKRCGKSRLLEILELVVARPWRCDHTSAAALLRSVERDSPTLLLDEWDSAAGSGDEYVQAMRGLLNSGFRRGGAHRLCVGEDREPHDFPTFCPKAIAGIGKLPDTVADRSIPIVLRRKARNETVKPFRRRDAEPEAAPLRDHCEAWALQAGERLRAHRPDLPAELNDRQQDICEPLLAIADLAGGEWPKRARKALLELLTGEAAADESIGAKLLADCRAIFNGEEQGEPEASASAGPIKDRIASHELIERLSALEARPWVEWGRGARPITAPQLARQLGRFGIAPRNLREGGAVMKGYLRSDFADAWARYLPSDPAPDDTPPPNSPTPSRYTATRPANTGDNRRFTAATTPACSGTENGTSANNDAGCSGVAAPNQQNGAEGSEGGLIGCLPGGPTASDPDCMVGAKGHVSDGTAKCDEQFGGAL